MLSKKTNIRKHVLVYFLLVSHSGYAMNGIKRFMNKHSSIGKTGLLTTASICGYSIYKTLTKPYPISLQLKEALLKHIPKVVPPIADDYAQPIVYFYIHCAKEKLKTMAYRAIKVISSGALATGCLLGYYYFYGTT